jgi:hypothetical protein
VKIERELLEYPRNGRRARFDVEEVASMMTTTPTFQSRHESAA